MLVRVKFTKRNGTTIEVSGAKVELYQRRGTLIDDKDPNEAYYGTRPILNLIFTTRSLYA